MLEKAVAPHFSTLAWKIPWMEESGGLQSMGSLRVRHDWMTSLSLFTFMHWRRKWQPTPVFLPRKSQGRGAWWAAIYGVAQSRTRLRRLSSSSSSNIYKKRNWKMWLESGLNFTLNYIWKCCKKNLNLLPFHIKNKQFDLKATQYLSKVWLRTRILTGKSLVNLWSTSSIKKVS